MPRQSTGAHGIQRVLQHGLARQQGLQFVNAAARRFETLATARGEDEDSGWGEMHRVDQGMLDLEASQIMASLRGNGCNVTGKLRRDQPSIFAPHWPQRQERLHAAFRQLSGFCPIFHGPTVSQPETVGLPYNADRPLAALQLQSSPFG